MAYSPLGSPGHNWRPDANDKHVGENDIIKDIAKKYGKTTAQVTLKYLVRYVLSFGYISLIFRLYHKSFQYKQ